MSEWIDYAGDLPPVTGDTVVECRTERGFTSSELNASDVIWNDVLAYRVIKPGSITAPYILSAAAKHMADRAATYDKPEGERSMDATVRAFNAVTGRDLSESEGWLLLAQLKAVRLFQRPGYHQDSSEDFCSYAALLGEAKSKEVI